MEAKRKFEKHLDIAESGANAATLLSADSGLSKTFIKQIMKKGAVWLTTAKGTQRIRRADKLLPQGAVLHLYYDEAVLQQQPAAAELIADEGDYSVWFKPYGMLSQGSKWGDHCTIYRWAEQHLAPQRSAFIVHRLDRAASGLILLAHTKKSAAEFSRLFHERKVEKSYQARVKGRLTETMTLDSELDDKKAISHVMPLTYDEMKHESVVKVTIETGRKHQIRRHLAQAGHPIIGDRLYGDAETAAKENLALVACYLSFSLDEENQKTYQLDSRYCPAP
jgi:tRNA pseudouridine32 synthase/23S rRNA pseudouridine746 synthase